MVARLQERGAAPVAQTHSHRYVVSLFNLRSPGNVGSPPAPRPIRVAPRPRYRWAAARDGARGRRVARARDPAAPGGRARGEPRRRGDGRAAAVPGPRTVERVGP